MEGREQTAQACIFLLIGSLDRLHTALVGQDQTFIYGYSLKKGTFSDVRRAFFFPYSINRHLVYVNLSNIS